MNRSVASKNLFDKWPQRYDAWFQTPIGRLIKSYEMEIIVALLRPGRGELILDAGCGTGIFTLDFLAAGSRIAGLEISMPMLLKASQKTGGYRFDGVRGDMINLPFRADSFDKAVSITALEFIPDAQGALKELFRVVKPGGRVVVATLNSLSPWAARRKAKIGRQPNHVLATAAFRSPEEILSMVPFPGLIKTAIHFNKNENPARARKIEARGRLKELKTGAFVAAAWQKPLGG